MKDLFANLYNKVLSFFHQTESKDRDSAKDVACNRLKLVLMQDRTNLSPAIMDRMRKELVELLSKYLELDKELLDLNFEQEDEQMALMLSIPVIRAKEESEILALLDDDNEEKENNDEEEETSEGEEDNEEDDSDDDSEVTEESEEDSEEDTEEDTSDESKSENEDSEEEIEK